MATAHLSPQQEELLAQETPACNSCGQVAATLVYEARDLYYGVDPRPYRVVRCDGCGLVYLTPRPTPADIARAVAFLLSAEAGFITGQTIPVNGGSDMP